MDYYNELNKVNLDNQSKLTNIKTTITTLDNMEKILYEKITLLKNELLDLDKDYINIIETYNHIIYSLINR